MRCLYCHNRDTWDLHDGQEVTVDELMKEAVTYRHFMNASGGGVTASGGEAILQAEFVRDWFRECKKKVFTPARIPMVLSAVMTRSLTS